MLKYFVEDKRKKRVFRGRLNELNLHHHKKMQFADLALVLLIFLYPVNLKILSLKFESSNPKLSDN